MRFLQDLYLYFGSGFQRESYGSMPIFSKEWNSDEIRFFLSSKCEIERKKINQEKEKQISKQ